MTTDEAKAEARAKMLLPPTASANDLAAAVSSNLGKAAAAADFPSVRQWLEKGADPNEPAHFHYDRYNCGGSPLFSAVANSSHHYYGRNSNHVGVVKALVEAKADCDWQDPRSGKTVMHLAIERCGDDYSGYGGCSQSDGLETVRYLKTRADLNARDNDGMTPLMVAAQRNEYRAGSARSPGAKITKMLLEAGADPTQKNNEGKNAWEIAHEKGNLDQEFVNAEHYDLLGLCMARQRLALVRATGSTRSWGPRELPWSRAEAGVLAWSTYLPYDVVVKVATCMPAPRVHIAHAAACGATIKGPISDWVRGGAEPEPEPEAT